MSNSISETIEAVALGALGYLCLSFNDFVGWLFITLSSIALVIGWVVHLGASASTSNINNQRARQGLPMSSAKNTDFPIKHH